MPRPEVEPAVRVEDLTVRFGSYEALSGVEFSLPQGASMAIVGPNGAGKSTLLKVLLGLIKPDSGGAWVQGYAVGKGPVGRVGYVPQMKTLDRSFPALVVELVASALSRTWPVRIKAVQMELVMKALSRVGAAHLAQYHVGGLSGGELQRVYLARALLHEPALVVLDEPAAGIDAVGEADLYRLLDDYWHEHQATVVMITHDWEVAYHHATHVLVLNRRKIGFGPPEQALSEECLRQAFGHVGHVHKMALNGVGKDA